MGKANIQMMIGCMVFVYLGVSACWDLRYKRIPWSVQGMGMIFVCISLIVRREELTPLYLLAFAPGIILLVLAWATPESIGYADGIGVVILGGMIGFRGCIGVLCVSLFLVSIFGICLLILKKVTRKSKIPYLPFLFLAQSCVVALGFV